ncbi:MAG: cation:proton antiporter [Candidatus Egerieousia sp.]
MTPLLHDLALILIVAGVVTIIFKALKQSLVLGYIIAGVLTGPYIGFIPTATEISSVEFWGKIGVIFLLFGLGLEFSFKKLKTVGGPGAIAVFAEAVMMFSMGFLVGKIFGWSQLTSIFLGAMLAISSTSIIIKTFEDLGIGGKKSSQLAIGALISEDLVAILMLVLLPTFVISKTFNGQELFMKIFSISIFLLLWFTGGIYLIPTLFRKLRKLLSGETLIVVSLGLCLLMVVISLNANISEALGAFVMGSILSGTAQRDKIVKLIKPIKDFFGAIFFVSVGMLVDPSVLLHYWPHILVITATIILAKPISVTIGFLFGGQPLKIALPAGMCLCQIGEFSYIIATLGRDMKATPDYLYPVIVAVSILTTFATPYMVRAGEPAFNFLYNHVGESWKRVIDRLGTGKRMLNQESSWKKLIKSYISRVLIYTTWSVAVGLIFVNIVNPYLLRLVESVLPGAGKFLWVRVIEFVITILAMAPFMWALVRKKDKSGAYEQIWEDRKFYRGPLLFMVALKYIIALIAVSMIASIYIAGGVGALLLICLAVVIMVVLSKRIKRYYGQIEHRFLVNLDSEGGRRFVIPRDMANEMHMEKCVIGQNSFLAGKSIGEVHRKKNTGALVIQVIRGKHIFNLPPKTQVLYPADSLLLLGSDAQISAFMNLSDDVPYEDEVHEGDIIEMKLFQITLDENSPMVGCNANITQVREKFGVLIIGVEKENNDDFVRPNSSVLIEKGDTVWVVGSKLNIEKLNQSVA